MKFIAKTAEKCGPRLGVLTEFANRSNFVVETPLAMLYTKGGSIPNITHEIFKICCKEPQILQISIASTFHYQDALEEFGEDISKFVGLSDCASCVTVLDPGDITQPGHHYRDHIPVWTRNGKMHVNVDKYMDTIEAFRPDMYYVMSDGDTNMGSPKKRIQKSVDNTIQFFKGCMERHKQSETLKETFVFAAIAGGYCLDSRLRCIEEITSEKDVGGYLIDGLHNNGPEAEFVPTAEVDRVVDFVISKLPGDKCRSIQGCWNPLTVIRLVRLGVDVFDTSYSYIVTERSSALTFAIDPNDEGQVFEINLRHPKYADDFRPISRNCDCLTCTKHSRGYVYHLIAVQELLGPLLLTIHNIHHYMKFFSKIRSCIKDGSLDVLEQLVKTQFDEHQTKMNRKKEKEISRD